jgi:hypothetical protein
MKRCALFLSSMSLVLSPLSASQAQKEPTVKEIVQRETPAIVSVYNLNAKGELRGTGTGFIIRSDGIIITNYHVIRGAGDVQIKLKNGEVYDRVRVIDFHPARDIAILKIPAMSLPYVTLGDSEKVEPGDEAVAIGNPKGLEHTVSDGLISAKRILGGTQMFQISVPISPGSSGGPLYNRKGEVIGITTSGLVGEGTQNLNFAVPLKYALPMIEGTDRLTLAEVAARDPEYSAESRQPAAKKSDSAVQIYQEPNGICSIAVAPAWTAGPPSVQGSLLTIKKDPSQLNVLHLAGFTDVKAVFNVGDTSVKSALKNLKRISSLEETTLDGRPYMGQHYSGKVSGVDMRAYIGAMVTPKGGLICMVFVPALSASDVSAASAMCATMR